MKRKQDKVECPYCGHDDKVSSDHYDDDGEWLYCSRCKEDFLHPEHDTICRDCGKRGHYECM